MANQTIALQKLLIYAFGHACQILLILSRNHRNNGLFFKLKKWAVVIMRYLSTDA